MDRDLDTYLQPQGVSRSLIPGAARVVWTTLALSWQIGLPAINTLSYVKPSRKQTVHTVPQPRKNAPICAAQSVHRVVEHRPVEDLQITSTERPTMARRSLPEHGLGCCGREDLRGLRTAVPTQCACGGCPDRIVELYLQHRGRHMSRSRSHSPCPTDSTYTLHSAQSSQGESALHAPDTFSRMQQERL